MKHNKASSRKDCNKWIWASEQMQTQVQEKMQKILLIFFISDHIERGILRQYLGDVGSILIDWLIDWFQFSSVANEKKLTTRELICHKGVLRRRLMEGPQRLVERWRLMRPSRMMNRGSKPFCFGEGWLFVDWICELFQVYCLSSSTWARFYRQLRARFFGRQHCYLLTPISLIEGRVYLHHVE